MLVRRHRLRDAHGLQQTFTVPVPVDRAWDALLDPQHIAPCMPGASFESVEGDAFTGNVKIKLGLINLSSRTHHTRTEQRFAAHLVPLTDGGRRPRASTVGRASNCLTEMFSQVLSRHSRPNLDTDVDEGPERPMAGRSGARHECWPRWLGP
jgi:uncharacterized protein